METQWLVALVLVALFISYKLLNSKQREYNLPPGPPSLPIIGHFHTLLKLPLPVSVTNLAKQYGPILFLRFGSRPVLVLSSSTVIKECFTKNDIIFANRPRLLVGKLLNYNYTVFAAAPYGDLWRNLRRLTTTQIFSTHRLQISSSVRQEEVRGVIQEMCKDYSGEYKKVELRSIFYKLTFNIMTRLIGMKPFFVEDEMVDPEKAKDKLKDLRSTFSVTGIFGVGDFFPFLKWVDHWRAEKIMLKLSTKRDKFMQDLIEDYKWGTSSKEDKKEGKENRTLIDVLLALQESEPAYYTYDITKGIMLAMYIGGTETSATTMEWAMSLLLNHREVLNKARGEIEVQIGYDRLLNESDLDKLPYLQNIINETLRVCSMGQYLSPHESSETCTVGGHTIPRGTMLLVDQMAIHKDPKEWPEPTVFRPERFDEFQGDNEGFKWIAFGVGRRGCPGEGLARRVMGLTLGMLIQCFEWDRLGGQMVDMTPRDAVGFNSKAKPLEALYKPCENLVHLLS